MGRRAHAPFRRDAFRHPSSQPNTTSTNHPTNRSTNTNRNANTNRRHTTPTTTPQPPRQQVDYLCSKLEWNSECQPFSEASLQRFKSGIKCA